MKTKRLSAHGANANRMLKVGVTVIVVAWSAVK